MLTIFFIAKGMLEVVMAFLLTQGLLWMLLLLVSPGRHESNPIYQIIGIVNRPLMKLTKKVVPKFVLDKHLGLYAFWILCVMWFVLLLYLPSLCASYGLTIVECKRG